MKKRVFYVINLDRNRILVLGVLITGFLLISFATGYRFGTSSSGIENRDLGGMRAEEEALMDPSRQGLERSLRPDEPSLQAPSGEAARSTRDQLSSTSSRDSVREEPRTEPARTERSEPARRQTDNRTSRRPATQPREEKKEQARLTDTRRDKRDTQAKREEKAAPRQTKESRQPASRREQSRGKSEAESKQREPARRTQAVKLEPEKSIKMSNTAANPAPARDSAPPAAPAQTLRSLQLGSFTSRTAASRMEAELKKQGFESAVVAVRGKFAVRVGRSASDADITRLEKQLKQKNYNPVRVSLP